MDLRHLRYFVAVAEEKHFGRAAQRLHIVQPALSMQIRSLEEEIGGALFVRTSRNVELTQAGSLLLVEARRTLAQAERTKDIVQRSLRGETGTVRVGFAGNAVVTGKLTDNLRAFRQRYPDAELQPVEMSPHLQSEAILAGQLDVGYSPSLGSAPDPRLIVEKIGAWPLLIAMAEDHPLAKKKRVSVKSLVSETLILYGLNEGEKSVAMLSAQMGTQSKAVHRVSSTLTVLALAGAGFGVAIVPAPVARVAIPNLTYRPIIETEMSADLMLLSRANETSGAVLAFLALARENR
ncbi:LysR substrate-binding domain-containing protein [Caballeronia sordidicola]|uniref:LysR family transcriptional regulator YnfL n=1 Tax=Caballeronia sordidicola TaxID=196367 RepID=A0A242MEJ5_CABSO|nr:LysR substrate-binding domain-containing protein [Caballeronia sordidicola]OTP69724.1 LysR family transcriptional regulator YnfL [Caballeronia sordidicola]